MSFVRGEDRRVACPQAEGRRGLPGVAEAPQCLQLVCSVVGDERAEDATRSDRAELVGIAGQDELRVRRLDHFEQPREVVGADHAGLVQDDDAAAAEHERRRVTRRLVEELGEGLRAHACLLVEDLRGHRRRSEADRLVTGGLPARSCLVEGTRLSRARRADEEGEAFATGE